MRPMKKVILLGSTGNLGSQCVEVLKKFEAEFRVVAVSGKTQPDLLRRQGEELGAQPYLDEIPPLAEADIVINVLSGLAGIPAALAVLAAEKKLILANKESIFVEGQNISVENIIPLDSEHNSIYEILKSRPGKPPRKLLIPCSGGPFWNFTAEQLAKVTPQEALAHPRWKMGPKISFESATLINKGLEIVEAHYLFKMPLTQIEAVYHPQCLIHGAVEFEDETLAYYAEPDMKEHIENALLRAADLPLPQRDIHPLTSPLPPAENPHLPGIRLVLENFQKDPHDFLEREEKILHRFSTGEISFPEIFTLLEESASLSIR